MTARRDVIQRWTELGSLLAGGGADLLADVPLALRTEHGDARALYDLAAVAIARDPSWGTAIEIPAPQLVDGQWVERPDNPRRITIWERFDRDAIVESLFEALSAATPRT